MASLADVQRKQFQDRIARIRKGGGQTGRQIYIGPADDTRGAVVKRVGPSRLREALGEMFMVPFALAIGALAMLSGRVAAYHGMANEGAALPAFVTPEHFALAGDITIAAVVLTLLGWSFRLGGGLRRLALITGFIGTMLGEAALIETAPAVFGALFSETYVAEALGTPDPFDPRVLAEGLPPLGV